MKISEREAIVLERLIQAMETDIALPVRVGPKAFGSLMPEYLHTDHELYVLEREDLTETGGKRWAERKNAKRLETERRARCTRERITAMEEAFAWVIEHIGDEERRKVLLAYAEVKARGWQWERYLSNRNRRHPAKRAWIKRTVQRWIVQSLQEIAAKSDKGAFFLHDEGHLLMAQIEPEHGCKSITSGLRAWMAPDGKPDMRRT
ncbi:hypothetical protein [Ensifer aridi]|uniref:hypothetical protein n=1 Tax=Ensifer aridi TaxID=1708715 RepID=UPI000A0F8933|nr:hypothetical protein [Ensifer aridi]